MYKQVLPHHLSEFDVNRESRLFRQSVMRDQKKKGYDFFLQVRETDQCVMMGL